MPAIAPYRGRANHQFTLVVLIMCDHIAKRPKEERSYGIDWLKDYFSSGTTVMTGCSCTPSKAATKVGMISSVFAIIEFGFFL